LATEVRLLSSVSLHVFLQVASLGESLITYVASKWPLPSVHPFMHSQATFRWAQLVAVIAAGLHLVRLIGNWHTMLGIDSRGHKKLFKNIESDTFHLL
jgi:hypothetical protein